MKTQTSVLATHLIQMDSRHYLATQERCSWLATSCELLNPVVMMCLWVTNCRDVQFENSPEVSNGGLCLNVDTTESTAPIKAST